MDDDVKLVEDYFHGYEQIENLSIRLAEALRDSDGWLDEENIDNTFYALVHLVASFIHFRELDELEVVKRLGTYKAVLEAHGAVAFEEERKDLN